MLIEITDIDLFDLNVGMACANVRLRCLLISLTLIYLIKMWVCHDCWTQMFMDITGIDLFDEIRDMPCVEIRLRCS